MRQIICTGLHKQIMRDNFVTHLLILYSMFISQAVQNVHHYYLYHYRDFA